MNKIEELSDSVHEGLKGAGYGAIPWVMIIDLILSLLDRCQEKQELHAMASSPTRLQTAILRRAARRSMRDSGVRPTRSRVDECCAELCRCTAALTPEDAAAAIDETFPMMGEADD